jgi:hypothetical protein
MSFLLLLQQLPSAIASSGFAGQQLLSSDGDLMN